MRPALRLATSNVFGRRGRTLLLVAVVAMSAALIAAVGTAMSSVTNSLRGRVLEAVGAAEARIRSVAGGNTFDQAVATRVAAWPEVQHALPVLQTPMALRVVRPVWEEGPDGRFARQVRAYATTVLGNSSAEGPDFELRPFDLVEGRLPRNAAEIVIGETALRRLQGEAGKAGRRSTRLSQLTTQVLTNIGGPELPPDTDLGPEFAADAAEAGRLNDERDLKIGGTVEVVRLGAPKLRLTVVGLSRSELFGGRPMAYMTLEGLQATTMQRGRISQVDVKLVEGQNPAAFVAAREPQLKTLPGEGLLLQTSAQVTAGFDRNLEVNRMGLLLASTMAFLAASFIIMTGMSVNILERQRELAILRCIGASRGQVAEAQFWIGLTIGVVGSAIGVPLGLGLALGVLEYFKSDLRINISTEPRTLITAGVGAVMTGLIGAVWPAVQAARLSPLNALAIRARKPPAGAPIRPLIAGVVCLALHLVLGFGIADADEAFLPYILVGLPALFLGYFLLSVPLISVLARTAGPLIARLFALPPALVRRSVAATPYRFGFTAGAMMIGLALMVAIWTQGSAILRDWLGKLEFPDVFVTGVALKPVHEQRLRELPFVTGTVPITLQPVQTEGFGIEGVASYGTTFIGFEPEPFFRLARLVWIQGEQETALRRLQQGGAVIVAREFLTARGQGLGSTFTCSLNGRTAQFEIVGVVSSPGLDLVNQFFDLGESYTEQAVHAVFGTRTDLRDRLMAGVEPTIQLIQVGLSPPPEGPSVPLDPSGPIPDRVNDEDAERIIRERLLDAAVLDVGNGRKIKADVNQMVSRSLVISSAIAVLSMVVACFGVANLIVAGIDARRFEFGVLRAVGAPRGVVLRLVLAEALVIALAACVLGTMLGVQAVAAGQHFDSRVLGIELSLRPPPGPIAIGWLAVIVMTLGAAGPAVFALGLKRPRELLAAVRG